MDKSYRQILTKENELYNLNFQKYAGPLKHKINYSNGLDRLQKLITCQVEEITP